jgi:hypothetical protein
MKPELDVAPRWHTAHLAVPETDGDEFGVRISIHALTDVVSDLAHATMFACNLMPPASTAS